MSATPRHFCNANGHLPHGTLRPLGPAAERPLPAAARPKPFQQSTHQRRIPLNHRDQTHTLVHSACDS